MKSGFSRNFSLERDQSALKHGELTEKIIRAYFHVYNALGYGFLEKVYENALIVELTKLKLAVKSQVPIKVFYEGTAVGVYYADIVVENIVIVEVKTVQAIAQEHNAQLLNYLKATGKEVGLVLNFGPRPQISRRVN